MEVSGIAVTGIGIELPSKRIGTGVGIGMELPVSESESESELQKRN